MRPTPLSLIFKTRLAGSCVLQLKSPDFWNRKCLPAWLCCLVCCRTISIPNALLQSCFAVNPKQCRAVGLLITSIQNVLRWLTRSITGSDWYVLLGFILMGVILLLSVVALCKDTGKTNRGWKWHHDTLTSSSLKKPITYDDVLCWKVSLCSDTWAGNCNHWLQPRLRWNRTHTCSI